MRTFVELVERYVDSELCSYPEYKGKPYYSIKYIENGEEYVGYSTYSLRVMSEFLKKYFISSALEKQEADRWHSVAKEGNPKKSGLYIVTDNSKMDGNEPHTRYFNAYGEKAFWSGWRADEVIAWKEITSEPYTEDEDEEQKSSN